MCSDDEGTSSVMMNMCSDSEAHLQIWLGSAVMVRQVLGNGEECSGAEAHL